jgi:N-acetylneuraminic acid mutarotase
VKRVLLMTLALMACTESPASTTVEEPIETTAGGTTQPDPRWVEGATMRVARSEHPAVVLDGRIVIMGGLIETGVGQTGVTPSVEAYDPVTDSWSDLPDLPAPRHHAMAAVVDDRLFFIGGYDEAGFNPTVDVWELSGDTWVERANLPTPVGAAAAVVLDGLIYIVGGVPNSGLFVYDPAADAWTELEEPSEKREHLAAVALEGEVWAIGGRWEVFAVRTVEIYDPVSDSWRDGPQMIQARSGFGATVVDGMVMVAGGEVFEPVQALDTVEVLGMMLSENNTGWLRSVELPMGLHGNPLVTIGDQVYLPGGSIEAAAVDNPGQLFFITP